MLKHTFAIIIAIITLSLQAQMPGTWTSHYTFTRAHKLADAGDKIFCASENALFSYSKADGTMVGYTKTDRLSDVGVTAIAYAQETATLVVGYENGNIDLVTSTGTVNMPDLKLNKLIPNKSILHILIDGNMAYLSTDFGISVLNLVDKEFTDTYFIGSGASYIQVNQISLQKDKNRIYAATQNGLLSAPLLGSNLADYSVWSIYQGTNGTKLSGDYSFVATSGTNTIAIQKGTEKTSATTYLLADGKVSLFKKQLFAPTCLEVSNDKFHLATYTEAYIYDKNLYLKFTADSNSADVRGIFDILQDESETVWSASLDAGLVNITTGESFAPNGPFYDHVSNISFVDSERFLASYGKVQSFYTGAYSIFGPHWYNQILWGSLSMLDIVPDPLNEGGFYCGSLAGGIHYFSSFFGQEAHYDATNSILEDAWEGVCPIYDLAFDDNNVLWIANWNGTSALKALDPDGNWHAIKHPGQTNNVTTSKIFVSQDNTKWVIDGSRYLLFAYNENETLSDTEDDLFTAVGVTGGEDQPFANEIFDIKEDIDGTMWIGTDNGIATYSNAENVFTDEAPEFRRIKVEVDSIIDYMLEGIAVQSIAIDAGNRKWLGTMNNGIYLLSANGTEILKHYNAENSPLPSNSVHLISVRQKDGEVFLATNKGMVSFKGDAELGVQTMDKFKVVPNPIREDYYGEIFISGLVPNAFVKITDLAGNLVYETFSNGGVAVWNGMNLLGNRPKTGVYLIFASNEDGSEAQVGKLMFIN